MLDKQFFLFQMSGIYQIIPNSMDDHERGRGGGNLV